MSRTPHPAHSALRTPSCACALLHMIRSALSSPPTSHPMAAAAAAAAAAGAAAAAPPPHLAAGRQEAGGARRGQSPSPRSARSPSPSPTGNWAPPLSVALPVLIANGKLGYSRKLRKTKEDKRRCCGFSVPGLLYRRCGVACAASGLFYANSGGLASRSIEAWHFCTCRR
jgi:hypothetical protein